MSLVVIFIGLMIGERLRSKVSELGVNRNFRVVKVTTASRCFTTYRHL